MQFTIHDVGHGFCAHFMDDNGNVILWDCGHKQSPEYRPSSFLPSSGIRAVTYMVISNYDEDHISDLPNLVRSINIRKLIVNESISVHQLRQLKEQASGQLSPAMQTLLSLLESFVDDVEQPSLPNATLNCFCCKYSIDVHDTNNLSIVSFLETPIGKFVIPGDIEQRAWLRLLEDPEFRGLLGDTDVFVASHHGRTSGYCSKVFHYCKPSVVIFSDGPKKYATQEQTNIYAEHASGVEFNGRTRYVLTTRCDGSISWSSNRVY